MLFAGMVAFGEAGRWLARRRAASDPEGTWSGIGVIDAAVFALLGLIVAFTFSGAASRFDARRHQIVEESNAIGTAYLRLDLLPNQSQAALRDAFRRYVDSRIAAYGALPDAAAARVEIEKGNRIQGEIWELGLSAARDSQAATMLLTPALNEMFDVGAARTWSTMVHPPPLIFFMLFGLAVIAAGLAGYEMARSTSRNWLHLTAFAAVTSVLFFVILDLEYPRVGLIRLTEFDRVMTDLRASMN